MRGLYTFLICLILGTSIADGQKRVIDSLRNALKTAKEDTNKIYLLKSLAWAVYNQNPDTALIIDTGLIKLCESLSTSPDKAIAKCARRNTGAAYYYAAVFHQHKGNFVLALEYNKRALTIFNEVGYQLGIANTYNMCGIIYKEEGNYSKAMENFFKSLEIDEKIPNKLLSQGADLGNIGVIYNKLGEYDKALDYYTRALKISRQANNKIGEARNLDNMGTVYEALKDYNKAIEVFTQAEEISQSMDDKSGVSIEMSNIGSIYYTMAHLPKYSKKQKDSLMDKSLESSTTALKLAREVGLRTMINVDLVNVGSDMSYYGKNKEAEKYMQEAIALSDSIGAMDTKSGSYQLLSDIYASEGDYKNAYDAYKKYSVLKDTIYNTDKNKEITRNEINYEFEKKEAALKAEQDKKDLITAEEKKKQNIIEYSVSGGLLLVLLLAAFIFRGYRQKQKANLLLEEQKAKVDVAFTQLNEKHKEITDSINYAKRIQRALLKDEEYMSAHLPEHYILFKPRDVVSGDFYWSFQKKDKWYVAAVDCTGHGVPGAFLTMLGSAFLNEICSQPGEFSPAEILNQLREKVVKELSAQGEVKDGMDISLCCIPIGTNTDDCTVEWAGANNPLWYFKQGELKEIVADKQPIGYQEGWRSFSNRTLQLKKGDVIYLFTDGYADQFGGEKGKKFKYKQLQQLIMDNAQLTMKDQKELLDKTFESWKGNLEQTDDVCIMGIRI